MASVADTALPSPATDAAAASYRKLTELFHDVLSERGLEQLLERLSATLAEIVPCDRVVVYEADEDRSHLVVVHARGHDAAAVLADEPLPFGQGLTGWAIERREPVLSNRADLDARSLTVPGTDPDEPEALIVVPLVARGALKGALNIARLGTGGFTDGELELVVRAGDVAALAIDDAETRASLERQARTDSLTGALNTRALQEDLRDALERAAATGAPTALVMLDVDDFKKVNDVYGHLLGDDLLLELMRVLRETVRAGDEIGRLGGDELAVVAQGADAAAARGFAERIATRVKSLGLPVGDVAVSIGIAVAPAHATTARELLARAESAMMAAKAAKQHARGGIAVFGEGVSARPVRPPRTGERSLVDLRLLYGLATKLVQLDDATEIAEATVGRLERFVDLSGCAITVGGHVLAERGSAGTWTLVIPLRHGGVELGELAVQSPAGGELAPADVRLLESLAVHVGAALGRVTRSAS